MDLEDVEVNIFEDVSKKALSACEGVLLMAVAEILDNVISLNPYLRRR